MAKIFTHADLKAIRPDDSFHDLIKRKNYDGTLKSFGESCDFYAEKIENYVQQLQYTQPFFPTTEFPSASRVSKAITEINTDGSTNIKGVYVDKDGLVVIKYNEVEDWEKIGFPKGSISRGIETKGVNQENEEFDINTGNIKFFVHDFRIVISFCARSHFIAIHHHIILVSNDGKFISIRLGVF